MGILFSFFAVIAIVLIALVGVEIAKLHYLFGVIIPYAAFAAFVTGFIYRVIKWGRSPVPFRIPTTCGQQKSLPWINYGRFENPSGLFGVIVRMAFEVLFFRSLYRNIKFKINDGRIAYASTRWLWVGAITFHWSFLIILLRHLRLVALPVPLLVQSLDVLDGFLYAGLPKLFLTDIIIVVSLTYLFLRRIAIPQMKYMSLAADYFPLLLILGITISGILMRYFIRTDMVSIKVLIMGIVSFNPVVSEGIGAIFYIHLFLISILLIYFPFSKLVHLGGVFLSPTRNLANNSRMKRHINPWNYSVKIHSYEEYEDDFREKMKTADIPVEKE